MSLEFRGEDKDGDTDLGDIKHRDGIKIMGLNKTTKKVSVDGKGKKVHHYEALARR